MRGESVMLFSIYEVCLRELIKAIAIVCISCHVGQLHVGKLYATCGHSHAYRLIYLAIAAWEWYRVSPKFVAIRLAASC